MKICKLAAGLVLMVGILFVLPCGAVEAPRNPNSAKECAICHYRWIDTFFIDGRGSDLVEYQSEKVVASAGMCYSCHDGSVVDSRARVYNDHRHPIDKPPPKGMEIPAIFPLDEKGNMQCATCHTAHGVPSEMGIEKTIFIRTSNKDSAMCRMCHKDKDGGPAAGNHPVDTTRLTIAPQLIEHGGQEGSQKNKVICETCHSVHGSPYDKFLVESAKDSILCLRCHKDKEVLVDSGHDLRRTAPEARNIKGKTAAESGICGTCHLVHGGGKVALWARAIPDGAGDPTQKLCNSCHTEQGIGKKKVLKGTSHPVNVSLQEKGLQTTLPTFNEQGRRVKGTGRMSCPTCHDPHFIPAGTKRSTREDGSKESGNFLRLPNDTSATLCRDCHGDKGYVEQTDHDLRLSSPKSKNIKGQRPDESGVCAVCHLVHGGQPDALWAQQLVGSSGNPAQNLCLSCHTEKGSGGKKLIKGPSHPLNVDPLAKGLKTTLPLYSRQGDAGNQGVMSCGTCHDPHRWDPRGEKPKKSVVGEGDATNSFLRQPSAPASTLCADCHADQAVVAKTDHDLTVTAPKAKNRLGQTASESGVCGSCHLVHNGPYNVRLWGQGFGKGKGIMDKFCNGCHSGSGPADHKVPRVATHPENMLITSVGRDVKGLPNYFPIFQRHSGDLVAVGDISCSSCHDVHQWDPKVKRPGSGKNLEGRATNSFLRMQTYSLMCIDCHGLDALFRFKYYHDPKSRGPQHP